MFSIKMKEDVHVGRDVKTPKVCKQGRDSTNTGG